MKITNYISKILSGKVENYSFVSLIILLFFLNKSFLATKINIELFEWVSFGLIGLLGFIFFIKKNFLRKINLLLFITFIIYLIKDFNLSYSYILFLFFSSILSYYKCKLIYKNLKFDNLIVHTLLFFIIFYFSSKLIHWIDLDKFVFFQLSKSSKYLSQFEYLNYLIYIYTLTVYFTFFTIFIFSFTKDFQNKTLNKYWYVIPSIIFFIAAFNTSDLFCNVGGCAKYHWQPFIGPLNMMSQGGLLLWDIPSTYGFLSLISVYLIPFNDPWLKMYFLNSILSFFISIIIFNTLWNKNGVIWYFASLALVFALVYIIPTSERFANSAIVPQGGAIRFFWTILLIFTLIKFKDEKFNKQIIFSTPIWLIGSLWSAESAFFVNVIIFSFIFFSILLDRKAYFQKIKITSLLPISFLSSLVLISIFYYIKIGKFPDFYAFIEPALMNTRGYYSEIMSSKMPFVILLIILSFIIFLEVNKNYLSLKISIWFLLWSVSAITVGQSVGTRFLKILVVYIFGAFLLTNLLKKNKIQGFKLDLIPVLMIIIALSYGNPKFLPYTYNLVKNQDYLLKNVKHIEHKDWNLILTKIKPGNVPILYIEPTKYLNSQSINVYRDLGSKQDTSISNKIWLPIYPASNIIGLPKASKIKYIERWELRNPVKKAWYISPTNKTFIKPIEDVLKDYLTKYSLIKEVKVGKLIAKLYEKK